MEIINIRRSVREYDLTKEITNEEFIEIIKAGMQAPSARNQQPWEFLVIKNKEVLNQLATISPGSKILLNTNYAIVLLMEEDNTKLKSSFFKLEDMGACIQNMMLQATSMEIGTCWIGCAPVEERMQKAQEILNTNKEVFAILSIGKIKSKDQFYYNNRFKEERIKFIE
jgi:nitroreductase